MNFTRKEISFIQATLVALGLIGAFATLNSCGKKKSTSEEAKVSSTNQPEPTLSVSGNLALAIPAELSVVSPYTAETVSAALKSASLADTYSAIPAGSIVVSTNLAEEGYDLQNQQMLPPLPPKENISDADRKAVLEGAPTGFSQARAQRHYVLRKVTKEEGGVAACLYKNSAVKSPAASDCYGPNLAYQNHPDSAGGTANGILPRGDLGIWEANTTAGEACIANKMNDVISSVSGEVDDAIGIASMLACVARLDGSALPEVGKNLDLMPAATKAKQASAAMPFTFTSARMVREADHNGHPVYVTEMTYEVSPPVALPLTQATNQPQNNATPAKIQKVKVKHSPFDENNETYLGKLTMITDFKDVAKTSVCTSTGPDMATKVRRALTILYSKSSATRIQYEMRQGKFLSGKSDDYLFDANGNAKYPDFDNGDCNLGAEYAIFDLNPKVGTGKVAYSWLAGQSGENGRSMVVNVGINDAGDSKKGCGYYGFGDKYKTMMTSIDGLAAGTSTDKLLDRFICNWAGPGNNKNGQTYTRVQRQCIKQDSAGKFVEESTTSSKIKFSPQNSCVNNPATTFRVGKEVQPASSQTYTAAATTTDLLPIRDTITSPETTDTAVLKSDIAPPPAFAGF